MTFFDCTADLVGQLNGNGQKGMLQLTHPRRKFLTTPLPTHRQHKVQSDDHSNKQRSHRPQTPPPVLTPGKLLQAPEVVPCIRWPATGINAHSL